MLEFLPQRLWIANAFEVRNPALLFDAEIKAVVDVAYEELPAQPPRQVTYCRFPLNDGGGNSKALFQLAVSTIVELIRSEVSTAIACSAGMSRAPVIAAFAVAGIEDQSPQEVLERIGKQRALQLNAMLWNDALAALSE